MLKIAFDLDGTIADSISVIRELIMFKIKKILPDTLDLEAYGLIKSEAIYNICFDVFTIYDIKPFDGAIDFLKEIYSITKSPLLFISARDPNVYIPTYDWLYKYISPIRFELIFKYNKIDIIKNKNIKYWVDDNISTSNDISKVVKKVFLLSRSYNINQKYNKNVIPITNYFEIINILKGEL